MTGDAIWRVIEAEGARHGAALAENAARRLADSLARDCPDLEIVQSGAEVEIRGRNIRERQAQDPKLRWLGR